MNTKVISAYPACGKSFLFNNKAVSCLDSDSSKFSWIEKDGVKERNPEFPANYIKHIKENLGKVDYIFVSSHLAVRQALTDANVDFITVYPETDAKENWLERMKNRGNDEKFIAFQNDNWEKFTTEIEKEPHGNKLYRLAGNEYLNKIIEELD